MSQSSALSDDVFIQVTLVKYLGLVSGKSLMTSLQDSPTSRLVAGTDEEPNWDKLLNEAQFVALKISDPAIPAKTPLTHSKLSSTGSLRIQ